MPGWRVSDERAREGVESGINRVEDMVRVALGPNAVSVVVEPADPDDEYERIGAAIVKEAARRADEVAGGGSATAALLASSIARGSLREAAAGADPFALRRGIRSAAEVAVLSIQRQSLRQPSDDLLIGLASRAAGDDDLAHAVVSVVRHLGAEAPVTVEESPGRPVGMHFEAGATFRGGYASPYFATDPERMEAVLDDPYLLFVDETLTSAHDLLPVLERAAQAAKPIVVVAAGVEGEALATLVVNKVRGNLRSMALNLRGAPGHRTLTLEDMALLTGTEVVETGDLAAVGLDRLGRARRVVVDKDRTTIVGGAGDPAEIGRKARHLTTELAAATGDLERERLSERLAQLGGRVAVISVGGRAGADPYVRGRVDDAVAATKAALADGVVPGGGVALLRAQQDLSGWIAGERLPGLPDPPRHEDELAGARVVLHALEEPLRQIATNAGMQADAVVDQVRGAPAGIGFDASTGRLGDLLDVGVVDTAKVTRAAIGNAASVASLLLSTEPLGVAEPPGSPAAMVPRRSALWGDAPRRWWGYGAALTHPGEPPADTDAAADRARNMLWVTEFPEDRSALRRRRLYLEDVYRLETRFTRRAPAPDAGAEQTEVGESVVGRDVRFEVRSGGGIKVRRDGSGDTYSTWVTGDLLRCGPEGTDPLRVECLAAEAGAAWVEVTVDVDGRPIDNAHRLDFQVLGADPSPPAGPPVEPPQTTAESRGSAQAAAIKLTTRHKDSKCHVVISCERGDLEPVEFPTAEAEQDLRVTLHDVRRDLAQLARRYDAFAPAAENLALGNADALVETAKLGALLHRAMFGDFGMGDVPSDTRTAAEYIAAAGRDGHEIRPGARLCFEDGGVPFPWGVLYDGHYGHDATDPTGPDSVRKEGFWGHRFTIDRIVRRYSDESVGASLQLSSGKCRAVVNPTIRPEVVDGEGKLLTFPGGVAVEPIRGAGPFLDWLRESGAETSPLVYFYCHASPAASVDDMGLLQTETGDEQARLLLDGTGGTVTVKCMSEKGMGRPQGHPLVFLTACSAGQGDVAYVSPFDRLFLRRWGARALVASDSEVPAAFGVAFSREVLRTFLAGSPGMQLAEALADTARAALAVDNPFGLFFGVHGRPEVTAR